MSGDLKTIIVDALNDAVMKDREEFFSDEDADLGADRLATAIRDHLFDREKVRAALMEAITKSADDSDYGYHREAEAYLDEETNLISIGGGSDDFYAPKFKADLLVDRLIAGLAGGSE